MDKVFGALERLKTAPSFMGGTVQYMFSTNSVSALLEDYELVKQTLTELKSIKEAKPSEALECLKNNSELFDKIALENPTTYKNETFAEAFVFKVNALKMEQALLKAQELEKENELLKEIIKIFFDKGCPLHQYTNKKGELLVEVDEDCSTMILGEFEGVDLDRYLKEVLDND